MYTKDYIFWGIVVFVIVCFVVGIQLQKQRTKRKNKREFILTFSDFPTEAFSKDDRIRLVAKTLLGLKTEMDLADKTESDFMSEFNLLQKNTLEEVVFFLKKQHERGVLALRRAEATDRFNKACALASEFGFKKVALAVGWTEPSCDSGGFL